MDGERVLVRADRLRPAVLLVVGLGERVVYLARPDGFGEARAKAGGVGFPREDVFRFDANLFARLESEWKREGRTSPALWAEGLPYGGP